MWSPQYSYKLCRFRYKISENKTQDGPRYWNRQAKEYSGVHCMGGWPHKELLLLDFRIGKIILELITNNNIHFQIKCLLSSDGTKRIFTFMSQILRAVFTLHFTLLGIMVLIAERISIKNVSNLRIIFCNQDLAIINLKFVASFWGTNLVLLRSNYLISFKNMLIGISQTHGRSL